VAPFPHGAPIGLYVHVPFCAHICPYCDFNTYAGQESIWPRHLKATVRDMARQAGSAQGRTATSLFFGGGTPSLIAPEGIGRIVTAARELYGLTSEAEITLEANPNSVDETYFAGLRAAGVNRLSLGVQTMDRRGLRTLGRQHEASDAEAAFLAARRAGFDNVSLDLIFGWPGQTLESWERDLATALSWDGGPEHLSLYSLILEPGTPMFEAATRGILIPLNDDAAADLYETAIATLGAAGWTHYEVANWARRPELMSRHNALYWRNGDFLAFGAGGHGTLAGQRTMNHLLPKTYVQAIEANRPGWSNLEEIDERTSMAETMMLGLRLLNEGVSDEAFFARHGVSLTDQFGPIIDELVSIGMVTHEHGRVLLTERGLMLANDVCARFV
jgi:oxygen-independent coproporphyrinogen III oxidase